METNRKGQGVKLILSEVRRPGGDLRFLRLDRTSPIDASRSVQPDRSLRASGGSVDARPSGFAPENFQPLKQESLTGGLIFDGAQQKGEVKA